MTSASIGKAATSSSGRFLRQLVVTLSLVATLSACGGHAKGVMQPLNIAAEPKGNAVVDMLVATSRLPSGDPATLFSGERSVQASLTDVAVSIPSSKIRASGTVQWPKKLPPNPDTDFAVVRVQPVPDVQQAREWVRKHSSGGHAMVFIHGFNNTYEDSIFRFAQIVHDSGADVTPVLFTWPSRAKVFDYNYDKESTNYSRTSLENTLKALVEDKNIKDITILAHSMGTWLAMESIRQMAIRNGGLPKKIENVILASPDIDVDVFSRQWNELGKHKPNFTIFVSQDDRALALSRYISGDVQRLGQINPAEEPYKSKLEKAGITVVDLTKVKSTDRLNHGKFAESPEIVQLIGQRLVTGQTLTDSDVTLGDGITALVAGTVNTVGQVTATTVATPVDLLSGNLKLPKKKKPAEVEGAFQPQDAPSQ
ncbi:MULTISPECIES: alpha/beta hydrolase [Rhizobium/Agrobacterium group]|jgi:esterase/lipase superfamily enzyme|uniref:alpha/beta hydrolase n=1 Tax=Rhizobium/Agrobacterium group TaxID=227290 RepID=UPI000713F3A9|nr:alpha/beta hydrolase [Rhizobium sp. Root483D2]KQY40620.1 esterase [Rhizobium sp. Root483D2]